MSVVPINAKTRATRDYARRMQAAVERMKAEQSAFVQEWIAAMVEATFADVDDVAALGEGAATEVMRAYTAELLAAKAELVRRYLHQEPVA